MNSFKILTTLVLACFLVFGSFQAVHSQCGTNQTPVSIILKTDAAPQETSFQLRDLSTGSVIFSVSSSVLGPNGTFTFSTCAPAGHCLKAELIDSGLNGGSAMQIGIPNATFSSSNPGNFDQFETILVGGTQCTNLDDVADLNNYVVRARGKLTIGQYNRFIGSVAGGTNKNGLCLGDNNAISGWLLGGEVGYGNNSFISGFNGVAAFGKAPSVNPCGANATPAIGGFHIIPNPFGNVTNCEMMDLIPPTNKSLYVPNGVTTVLNGHLYKSIVVANGGTLLVHPGNYYGGELIIEGGKLMPTGGGTVSCDIFFQFSSVVFTEGSFVRAVINCEEVKIGNNNDFKGVLGINSKYGSYIGDNNVFALPDCPACVEKAQSKPKLKGMLPSPKQGKFEILPHPVQGEGFEIATQDFSYPADLMIYDLSGKIVHQNTLTSSSNQKIRLPGELPSGLYLCKLASHAGDTLTRKMTLQRE